MFLLTTTVACEVNITGLFEALLTQGIAGCFNWTVLFTEVSNFHLLAAVAGFWQSFAAGHAYNFSFQRVARECSVTCSTT
jgi:hypothetical protein